MAFWNTIFVITLSLAIVTVIGTMAAYVIDRYRFPGRGLILRLNLVTPAISTMVILRTIPIYSDFVQPYLYTPRMEQSTVSMVLFKASGMMSSATEAVRWRASCCDCAQADCLCAAANADRVGHEARRGKGVMMGAFVTLVCSRLWQLRAFNLMALVLVLPGVIIFGFAPALAATRWALGRLGCSAGDLARGMWGPGASISSATTRPQRRPDPSLRARLATPPMRVPTRALPMRWPLAATSRRLPLFPRP